MSSPKEKSSELVELFASKAKETNQSTDWEYDKQCAIICVDEILKCMQEQIIEADHIDIIYWKKVKKEIEKL